MNNNTSRDARRSTATGSPISAGEYPIGISISPNGAKAYVVDSESKQVSVIDTRTDQLTGAPIGVGTQPFGMAIAPAEAPAASFSVGRVRPGVPVTLDASGSSDAGGQAAKAESAPARIKVKAGSSAIVPLKPKEAFNSRLAGASRILVVETSTIAGVTDKRVRLLRVVS